MKISIATAFADLRSLTGQEVTVSGWIRSSRIGKSVSFIQLSDGSCQRQLQVVLMPDCGCYEEAARQGVGAAMRVTGLLTETPEAHQPCELRATAAEVVGECPPEYPLQKKRHSPEFLRTISHLRPRTQLYSAVFRVRSLISFAVHRFFNENGFIYVHTPIITASDCEGAGEMFRVTAFDIEKPPRTPDGAVDFAKDFFGKPCSLTVSGQLNAECFAQAFGKVYTFGPTFRAENSNTARHAAEFWMIEPEIAFANLCDDMDLCEAFVKHLINDLFENAAGELDFFNQWVDSGLIARLENVRAGAFERCTYTAAIEILEKSGRRFEFPVSWGCDLQAEHERYLTETYFGRPVFITDYPKDIKAFYMRLNDDGRTVAAMDLLVPGIGEIVGGSQREERLGRLTARMAETGMAAEDYEWYLDLRRYGTAPHAGFGLGLERFVMYATGVSNIRDVLPFARVPGSAGF